LNELNNAGFEHIFTYKISGAVSERPGLEKVEDYLRERDILVVWRLDI
jgi:DNA invertase Pin-like site-specific DNA recombinase